MPSLVLPLSQFLVEQNIIPTEAQSAVDTTTIDAHDMDSCSSAPGCSGNTATISTTRHPYLCLCEPIPGWSVAARNGKQPTPGAVPDPVEGDMTTTTVFRRYDLAVRKLQRVAVYMLQFWAGQIAEYDGRVGAGAPGRLSAVELVGTIAGYPADLDEHLHGTADTLRHRVAAESFHRTPSKANSGRKRAFSGSSEPECSLDSADHGSSSRAVEMAQIRDVAVSWVEHELEEVMALDIPPFSLAAWVAKS